MIHADVPIQGSMPATQALSRASLCPVLLRGCPRFTLNQRDELSLGFGAARQSGGFFDGPRRISSIVRHGFSLEIFQIIENISKTTL
jgi:hypothetical protein